MCWKVAVTILSLFGLSGARSSGLYSEESPSSIRLEQCHDGCIKKVIFENLVAANFFIDVIF